MAYVATRKQVAYSDGTKQIASNVAPVVGSQSTLCVSVTHSERQDVESIIARWLIPTGRGIRVTETI